MTNLILLLCGYISLGQPKEKCGRNDIFLSHLSQKPVPSEALHFTLRFDDDNSPGLDKDVTALKETFSSEGFIVDFAEPLSKERCYGDRENFIVINYNGDLYKCTARDFTPSNKEGLLTSDGELVWNDRYKLRIALKKCYPVCHRCMLFPICHAGCTQNKLETLLQDKECLYKYTENQKTKLLETKIEHRLKYSSL